MAKGDIDRTQLELIKIHMTQKPVLRGEVDSKEART